MAAKVSPYAAAVVVVISLLAAAAAEEESDRTTFSFSGFYETPPGLLIYEGDIYVRYTTLRLTRMEGDGSYGSNSVGRVLYSRPVKLWDDDGRRASFQTSMRLRTWNPHAPPADGMTFFIEPFGNRIPPASHGMRLGIVNESCATPALVAVEFDPYTNPELGDPPSPHIGIDVNTLVSKNVTPFRLWEGGHAVDIRYDAGTRRISVVATMVAAESPETYYLEYEVDLKAVLPQQVQVGISGSTGHSTQLASLTRWNFSSTMDDDHRRHYHSV